LSIQPIFWNITQQGTSITVPGSSILISSR
jgi:hypothetical protein